MLHTKTKKLLLTGVITLLSLSSANAADGWSIQPLVLPGDIIQDKTIVNVLPQVDIDEAGNVAFIADYTDTTFPFPGSPGRGIFTQDRVVVVVGDVIEGVEITDIDGGGRTRPSIANNIVAYVATIPPNSTILGVFKEQAVVVKPGVLLDPAGDTATGPFCCAASINNAGTVAFNSGASNTPIINPLGGNSTDQAIYTSPGDTSPGGVVVRKYQSYEGFALTQVRETALSNSGNVATVVSVDNPFGDGTTGAMMLNDRFVMKPGDPIGSSGFFYRGIGTTVSINDSDQMAFGTLLAPSPGEAGPLAVMTLDRVVVTQNDTLDGLQIRSAGIPEINNNGTVAFFAHYGNTLPFSRAIFLEDDLVATTGDSATGGILLTDLGLGSIGLNDFPEIAFVASYEISSVAMGEGLFIATTSDGEVDPVKATNQLIDDFVALIDSGLTDLNHGQGVSLLNKLENALKFIEDGNISDALEQLNTFVRRIEKLVAKGYLSAQLGDDLIVAANAIIAALIP